MTYSSYYLNNMKYNTDKPMDLRELPVNPCNNCENPNQMRDKRCGNCRFNAGVNYAIKSIVPQAIQATREETVEEIRKAFYKSIYGKQWVELGEPENFEAGKVSITNFEKHLDSLTNKNK